MTGLGLNFRYPTNYWTTSQKENFTINSRDNLTWSDQSKLFLGVKYVDYVSLISIHKKML